MNTILLVCLIWLGSILPQPPFQESATVIIAPRPRSPSTAKNASGIIVGVSGTLGGKQKWVNEKYSLTSAPSKLKTEYEFPFVRIVTEEIHDFTITQKEFWSAIELIHGRKQSCMAADVEFQILRTSIWSIDTPLGSVGWRSSEKTLGMIRMFVTEAGSLYAHYTVAGKSDEFSRHVREGQTSAFVVLEGDVGLKVGIGIARSIPVPWAQAAKNEYDVFGLLIEEVVTVGCTTTTTRYAYDGWNPAKAARPGPPATTYGPSSTASALHHAIVVEQDEIGAVGLLDARLVLDGEAFSLGPRAR